MLKQLRQDSNPCRGIRVCSKKLIVPWQFFPLPANPGLHIQVGMPAITKHDPFTLSQSLSVGHSPVSVAQQS